MLLLFIVYLIIMSTKRCSAKSVAIRDKKEIDSLVNNSSWWTPFLSEYHAFGATWNANKMHPNYDIYSKNEYGFDGSADSLFSVDVLMKVMIDEQILINIRTHMTNGSFQAGHKSD
eukprot:1151735_1